MTEQNINNTTIFAGRVGWKKEGEFVDKNGQTWPLDKYSLIVNQGVNQSGKEITNMIMVSVFGSNAVSARKFVNIGDCMAVSGALSSNLSTDEFTGKKHLYVNLSADTVKFGKNFSSTVNKVMLYGRLMNEPKISQKNGRRFASFSILVPRVVKKGEKQQSDLFNVVTFDEKRVAFIQRWIGKGMLVFVDGKISSSVSEEGGKKKYYTRIIADSIDFAETKRSKDFENQREEKANDRENLKRQNYAQYNREHTSNNRTNNNYYQQNNRSVENRPTQQIRRDEYQRVENTSNQNNYNAVKDAVIRDGEELNNFASQFMDSPEDFMNPDIF